MYIYIFSHFFIMSTQQSKHSVLNCSLPGEQIDNEYTIEAIRKLLQEVDIDIRDFVRIHPTTYSDSYIFKSLQKRKSHLLDTLRLLTQNERAGTVFEYDTSLNNEYGASISVPPRSASNPLSNM